MKIEKNIKQNIFRGYDIRGKVPTQIDEDVAYTVGLSYGSYIQEKGNNECIIGQDVRLSSPKLTKALVSGILETGCNIVDLGIVTTPMFYYARDFKKIPTGVMVTASHNPKDENGFKFSLDTKGNACGEEIVDFYNYTKMFDYKKGNGKYEAYNIENDYIKLMENNIKLADRKLKIIFDCANAATTVILRKIVDKFDIDYEILYEETDGNFPNHHPDPSVEENLNALKRKVLDTKADFGIAFDGDGDRLGIVDENANMIKTDYFMIIVWRHIINTVKNKNAIYDVKCSMAFEEELLKLGGKPFCNRTGNSYVARKIIEDDLDFGGEFSGHVYFNDRFKAFDSGIYASLRLAEILSNTSKNLSQLLEDVPTYPVSPEIKIPSTDEKKIFVVEEIKKYVEEKNYHAILIDGVKTVFEDGWILVRYSNTGPDLTIRIEAKTEERLNEIKEEFFALIEKYNK